LGEAYLQLDMIATTTICALVQGEQQLLFIFHHEHAGRLASPLSAVLLIVQAWIALRDRSGGMSGSSLAFRGSQTKRGPFSVSVMDCARASEVGGDFATSHARISQEEQIDR
jgi:hypothetical protein